MPEAPEVQTVLSTLEAQIKDVSIEDVLIYYPKIIDNVEVETFKNQLIGQTFHSFNRLGKYLIFGLDDYDLVVHLRMEGKFYLYNMLCENKHIHIVFKLNSGTYMSYHDTRKFGRMYLYPKKEDIHAYPCFKNVGYDYMDGTTIRSYTSSLGVTGRFQLYLNVHDQTQCKVCHHAIKKLTVSQRGTYLCPNCQKRK